MGMGHRVAEARCRAEELTATGHPQIVTVNENGSYTRRMSTRPPVPVTIVAGGAEAAALADRLDVRGDDAVIVSEDIQTGRCEPGRFSVLPDTVSRTAGCVCCRLRLDLVDAMARVACRTRPPRRVLVGLGPNEDVVAAVYTVLTDPELRRHVRLDGVVATLDAVAAATNLAVGRPIGDALAAERIAVADRIVISRGADVLPAALARIRRTVASVGRFGTVVVPGAPSRNLGTLLGLDAWHAIPAVTEAQAEPTDAFGDVTLPQTVVLRQAGLLDPDEVEEWLDDVITQHAPRLMRLQGVLSVDGAPSRVCCHAVRSYSMSHPEQEHASGPGSAASVVVVTGAELDAHDLAEGLRRTVIR